jgi:peptidoglycan/xylan/chitin deacetylase (PgdA/CDA1 family)
MVKRAVTAIWNSAFQSAPGWLIGNLTPAGLVAPCYHLVSDRPPAHVRHLFQCRNVSQFKAELDWLLKRFNPVSLADLNAKIAAREPIPRRSLFISFDDGLRECIDTVAPICRAKGVPATFFISTGFTGNKSLCYRHKASLLAETWLLSRGIRAVRTSKGSIASYDAFRAFVLQVKYADARELDDCAGQLELSFDDYLRGERPYLDEEDIATLLRQGFSVGGHSVDHPLYSEIPFEAQVAQTTGCMQALKARFELGVGSFAFPFLADNVPERFIEHTLASETVALIFYTGAVRPGHDGRVIWRFGVEVGDRPFGETWKRHIGQQQMDKVRSTLKTVLA